MENIIYDDSPLAEYLEGEGTGGLPVTKSHSRSSSNVSLPPSHAPNGFAPRGPSSLQARLRERLPQPLQLPLGRNSPVVKIQSACSRALRIRLPKSDNARFLEHFRYVIIASQLLSSESSTAFPKLHSPPTRIQGDASDSTLYDQVPINLTGAIATGAAAFVLVWLLHWARSGEGGISWNRIIMCIAVYAVVIAVLYGYARRQWLQYLRTQAIGSGSGLVTNLQAFEVSSASAIALIQEVELVSRGYRISNPLPPISRLEDKSQARRCARLRRNLSNSFTAALPAFIESCDNIRSLIDIDDLERYYDVYDLNAQDLQEAALGYSDSEFEDADTLKALRIFQYRLNTLRRVFLCSLLALQADGSNEDLVRWRVAVDEMQRAAALTGELSEKLNRILTEEESFTLPPTPAKPQATPGRERVRNQVRKLSSLSQGIRGLQAKMQILREESNRTLEESEDVTELGSSLMSQYDSIGADLKSLMQAWETGKAALALNIDRHERRISQASSGLRSPVPSLGGLTVVDEGSPSDALRALNGETALHSRTPSVSAGSGSDEEIFEAIAIPRTRQSLTREERMAKIQEDRARQVSLREQREANTNMLKELESVINLRTLKRPPGARITSI